MRRHDHAQLLTKLPRSFADDDYLIIGTVERDAWRENMKQPIPPAEMLRYVHDFKGHLDLQTSMAGWLPEGQEPPLRPAPPSVDWVKKN